MAGANAAAQVGDGEALLIDRSEGYIGVMIDDLVTRGVTEPLSDVYFPRGISPDPKG